MKLVAPEIIKDLNVPDTIYAAVDKIIEHRETPGGATQYRVRWEKAGPEMDSWLFKEDFVDYGPLQSYGKKLGVDLRTKKLADSKKRVEAGSKPKLVVKKRVTVVDSGSAASQANQSKELTPEQGESVGVPVYLSLSSKQKDALGDYWKQTKALKRIRKQAIVESDSD